MNVKLAPLRLAGANFWPKRIQRLSRPLRVYLLLGCTVEPIRLESSQILKGWCELLYLGQLGDLAPI